MNNDVWKEFHYYKITLRTINEKGKIAQKNFMTKNAKVNLIQFLTEEIAKIKKGFIVKDIEIEMWDKAVA